MLETPLENPSKNLPEDLPENRSTAGPRTDAGFRRRLIAIYTLLFAGNVGAWAWAFAVLHDQPVLLGTAVLAYTFGLRHAVDADHIAAIDNVTRKFMQQGQRPVAAGLYFALGHAAVVVLMSIAVAFTASEITSRFDTLKSVGSIISTSASALFLFALAIVNVFVLASVYRTFQSVKRGHPLHDDDLDHVLHNHGFLARIFRPLFNLVTKPWHLLAIGFLFGLGFDTATEVALFGISSTQAAEGLSLSAIMVFPALFTAAMTLVDTTDGVLMLGAYGWAFKRPVRKLYYNMTITAVSIIAAVIVGSIETLGLIGNKLALQGPFWERVAALNENFGLLGYLIVATFVVCWCASLIIYRLKGYDVLDSQIGSRNP